MSENHEPEQGTHGARGAAGQDGHPERQDGATDPYEALVEKLSGVLDNKFREFERGPLNKAISSHLRRHGATPQPNAGNQTPARRASAESDDDDELDDVPAPTTRKTTATQAPPATDVQSRQQARELKRVREELEEMKAENVRTKEQAAKATRDGKLRRVIEAANVSEVETVFRYVLPDLKVDAEGHYYAEVDGEVLTDAEFVTRTVQGNRLFQRPSGRSGGGGTPESASSPALGGRAMSRDALNEQIDKAIAKGDHEAIQRLQADVGSGKIRVT